MRIAMIGLGRMGANLARRLLRAGHGVVAFDRDAAALATVVAEGAAAAGSLAEVVAALEAPRVVWVMLPSGEVTEGAVAELIGLLSPGDTLLEGGNSYFKDSIRRAAAAAARGVDYLDVGTSGGVWGLERGYCLMVGGSADAVHRLDPIFAALVPGEAAARPTPGWAGDERAVRGMVHAGASGAGHYAKMVHNGIEYGMMQAMAEGFALLEAARGGYGLDLPLPEIAEAWRRGSVVSSWLLDLTAQALATDPDLSAYSGRVGDSGEGRWTVLTAVETATPAPVLTEALYARFRSRQGAPLGDRVLSAMRHAFGGHLEPKDP